MSNKEKEEMAVYGAGDEALLLEEGRLVKKCQQGNRQAFNEIIKRYQGRIINMAYQILGNYSDAVDLTQDTFVKVYLSIKRFRGESSFYTWLYQITINLCRNRLKHRKRRGYYKRYSLDAPLELEEGRVKAQFAVKGPNPGESLVEKETRDIIYEAIDSLDEEHRLTVILRDREMLSYEEIARILKCRMGTVKSRLHRARAILKEKLKAQGVI